MVKKKGKTLASDKYIVYILPAGKGIPLFRIWRCNKYGKMSKELVKGGYYFSDFEEVGRAMVEDSKNVKDYLLKKFVKGRLKR